MKKIVILAMLCVFSVVSIQSAEAKSFDGYNDGKNVGKIEKKTDFEKPQTQINHQNKFDNKVGYRNGDLKFQRHHYMSNNKNRVGHYKHHKNSKMMAHNKYGHNMNNHRNYHNDRFKHYDRNDRRNSFYR